jgi:hypothetical protein
MKARELEIDTAKRREGETARGRYGETAIESKAVVPFGPALSEGSISPKVNNPLCALRVFVPVHRLAVSPFRRLESQGSQ